MYYHLLLITEEDILKELLINTEKWLLEINKSGGSFFAVPNKKTQHGT